MSRVVVEMTADEAKLHQALMSALSDFDKFEGGVKKTSAASRAAAKDEEALGRAAKQVYEATRTPMEQHQARMQRLAEMLQKGKMDQETYGRAASDSYAKMESALGRTGDAAKKTGEEMKGAGQKGFDAFGPQAVQMTKGFLAALGIEAGIAGGVRLIRDEWQAVIDTQNRAKQATMTVADAERVALTNLGAKDTSERDAFLAKSAEISKLRGISEKSVYLRSASALSARGDRPIEDVMEAVDLSALLAPQSDDEGKALATAALDIGKFTGATPKQAIGYLLKIGEMAHISSTGDVAENVAPAMRALMATGASLQKAGAVVAGMTQGMVDPTGRISSSASIGLATEMERLMPAEGETYSEEQLQQDRAALAKERNAASNEASRAAIHDPQYLEAIRGIEAEREKLRSAKGRRGAGAVDRNLAIRELNDREQKAREDAEAKADSNVEASFATREKQLTDRRQRAAAIVAPGFSTFDARLEYLNSHPEAAKDFLAKASFEKKAEIPIRELVTGKGSTAQETAVFERELPKDVSVGDEVAERYSMMLQTPRQITAQYERSLAAAKERQESDPGPERQRQARIAALADKAVHVLQNAGDSKLASELSNAGSLLLSDDYLASMADKLQKRAEILRKPKTNEGSVNSGLIRGVYVEPLYREATPGELNNAETLEYFAAETRKLLVGPPRQVSKPRQRELTTGAESRDPEHQLRDRADALFGRAAQTLRGIGNTRLASEVDAARDDMSGEQFTTLADRIQKQADALRGRHLENADAVKAAVTEGRRIEPQYRDPSAGELESVKTLTELVALTRELVAEMKRANAESAKPKSRPTLSAPDRDR